MKKPHGKSGRGSLDADDISVWDYATKAIKPLKRGKARVPRAEDVEGSEPLPRLKDRAAGGAKKVQALSAVSQVPEKAASRPKPAPPIAAFDRKKIKKLRSGRAEIEARIDLHGMRQHEAHEALRGFLFGAHARGYRMVLVITGKGKFAERGDDTPFDMSHDRTRGVLKRNVPHWLEESDLRGLVLSYSAAAIAHGGEGALYVHLRKKA